MALAFSELTGEQQSIETIRTKQLTAGAHRESIAVLVQDFGLVS